MEGCNRLFGVLYVGYIWCIDTLKLIIHFYTDGKDTLIEFEVEYFTILNKKA